MLDIIVLMMKCMRWVQNAKLDTIALDSQLHLLLQMEPLELNVRSIITVKREHLHPFNALQVLISLIQEQVVHLNALIACLGIIVTELTQCNAVLAFIVQEVMLQNQTNVLEDITVLLEVQKNLNVLQGLINQKQAKVLVLTVLLDTTVFKEHMQLCLALKAITALRRLLMENNIPALLELTILYLDKLQVQHVNHVIKENIACFQDLTQLLDCVVKDIIVLQEPRLVTLQTAQLETFALSVITVLRDHMKRLLVMPENIAIKKG